MTLLVPLYVHPAEDPGAWARLIGAAPRTWAVVLNPASGPGPRPDPAFTAAAAALRAAGARLLGYVDTAYGSREAAEAHYEMLRYREWYGVDGCFLDQVTADRQGLRACRRLVRSLRRLGAATVVLNPGVHPDPGYLRLADLVVTFEGDWATYAARFSRPEWTARHPPERFCHLVHSTPEALVPLAVRTARDRGAGVCGPVTGHLPNPWTQPTPALTTPDP
ncbi:spherulation-specific family 4 protein [Streptomyces sp. NBC_00249]|uniref:spherulation-specific family 4 protein n=1 Tax=Streptomyces sp. NBC_00249 TaxID=2975690 RepID=UPI00224EE274|nr:spherulation-specific family 4 protein [Streptomyces sp. NBC_00249]MCX5195567.1 spherulation-specific family 4 protein [Streptomyces sp. NBC_00249]